jgi:hypothetical protein
LTALFTPFGGGPGLFATVRWIREEHRICSLDEWCRNGEVELFGGFEVNQSPVKNLTFRPI